MSPSTTMPPPMQYPPISPLQHQQRILSQQQQQQISPIPIQPHPPQHSSPQNFHPNRNNLPAQQQHIMPYPGYQTNSSLFASPDVPSTPPPAPLEESPPQANREPTIANIYSAVYSGVPVYEMMSRGIAVMRRRSDSYLNATQILKVAGIDKGRRTKILEREILQGEHEKVQGGYGKYQGTWVPFERGRELAEHYGVEHYLRPLFLYDPNISGNRADKTPTKEQALAAQRKEAALRVAAGDIPDPNAGNQISVPARKRQRTSTIGRPAGAAYPPLAPHPSPAMYNTPPNRMPPNMHNSQPQSPAPYLPPPPAPEPASSERHRTVLMAIFLGQNDQVPELLSSPNPPADLDIDLVIDDQGHTALHWAAALARINIMRHLLEKGANTHRSNYMGETALIRSVLVTNNYDRQSFPALLDLLGRSLVVADKKARTVLHHIAITAGMKGRAPAAKYYMECVMEWIGRNGGEFSVLVDLQDKNGDTALNLAARVGNRYLIDLLVDVGASRHLENRVGLKPEDFGVEERRLALLDTDANGSDILDDRSFSSGSSGRKAQGMDGDTGSSVTNSPTQLGAPHARFPLPSRGRELLQAVEQIVHDIDVDHEMEIATIRKNLDDARHDMDTLARQVIMLRRQMASLGNKPSEGNEEINGRPPGNPPTLSSDLDAELSILSSNSLRSASSPSPLNTVAIDSEVRSFQNRVSEYKRVVDDMESRVHRSDLSTTTPAHNMGAPPPFEEYKGMADFSQTKAKKASEPLLPALDMESSGDVEMDYEIKLKRETERKNEALRPS